MRIQTVLALGLLLLAALALGAWASLRPGQGRAAALPVAPRIAQPARSQEPASASQLAPARRAGRAALESPAGVGELAGSPAEPALEQLAARPGRPTIRGRLLGLDGAPAVDVQLLASFEGPHASLHIQRTDERGRFVLEFPLDVFRGAHLEFEDPSFGARAQVEVGVRVFDPEHGVDLGDVRLEAGRNLHVRITDSAGAPLAGGGVRVELEAPGSSGGAARYSRPTDAEGRSLLTDLRVGARSVTAYGPGHAAREVPVPADLEQLLEIALEPCPRLEVSLRGPDGDPPVGLHVALHASRPPFATDAWGHPALPMVRIHGRATRTDREDDGWFHYVIRPDPHGDVILDCLELARPFEVLVVDAGGHEVLHLGRHVAQGNRGVILAARVEVRPRALHGTVHGRDGAALEEVQIELVGLPGGEGRRTTDTEGRFTFGALYRDLVSLRVGLRGWPPLLVEDVVVGAGPIRIDLPRSSGG